MRKRYECTAVALIATLIGACGSPRIDIPAEKAAVASRSKAVAAAEAARDIETTMSFWAEDAVVQMNGTAQIQGTARIRELMQTFFGSFKEFEGSTTQIELAASGDLAYEYGVNRIVCPGEKADLLAMGKYLLIWRKIKGVWLISAISVTNDDASPVPI